VLAKGGRGGVVDDEGCYTGGHLYLVLQGYVVPAREVWGIGDNALLGIDGSRDSDGYGRERRVGQIGVLDQSGGCGEDALDHRFDALFG
jgi:hypothetical protein